jgi:hypothetical protein
MTRRGGRARIPALTVALEAGGLARSRPAGPFSGAARSGISGRPEVPRRRRRARWPGGGTRPANCRAIRMLAGSGTSLSASRPRMIQAIMLMTGSFISGRLTRVGRLCWKLVAGEGFSPDSRYSVARRTQPALSFYAKKSGPCRATANFAGHPARVRSNSLDSTRLLPAWETASPKPG